MMLSSLIQHRTEARHFGRLSPGGTPACADQQHWRAIRSFAPARAPKIRAKATRSPASAQFPQHSRRRQIPTAPAALSVLLLVGGRGTLTSQKPLVTIESYWL
jgi:hypothetical protein